MRTRKHLTKIAATVALVAGAAGVAGVGTFGAYTDTTTADIAVKSGKVSVLLNGDPEGAGLDVTDMAPGDRINMPLTLSRASDSLELADLTLAAAATGDPALVGDLRMSIDICTKEWAAPTFETCTGTLVPPAVKDVALVNGSFGNWAQQFGWVTALNKNQSIFARASISLYSRPEGDPLANASADKAAHIVWTLKGIQRTGRTTGATPVGLTNS
ncbi:hypothetical protein [Nocardioides sp.]|uniref:hypothetical protein n=1 Tax=Nocardioides sp. TaxID=35761 RepID=UPI0025F821B8|nr:hypothetical protein [Nocardioides sp.]